MSNDGTLRPLASRTNWTPSSYCKKLGAGGGLGGI